MAHLTSHSRMAGSRWVITPSWLSDSWRSFLYGSSVYSSHLFLISYASVNSTPFLSFIVPIFVWNAPLVCLEGSYLYHSIVFLCFLALLIEEGFLISLCYSWNSEFKCVYLSFSPLPIASLLFSAVCKASSDHNLAFLHFFFLGMVLIPASHTVLQTSVHSVYQI